MEKGKILIISSQKLLREALTVLLNGRGEFQVIGTADCCQEGMELAGQLAPHLILVDTEQPDEQLVQAGVWLEGPFAAAGVVFFSSLTGKKRLLELIPFAARGYLTTDLSSEAFVQLLDTALKGYPAISPSVLAEVLGELQGALKEVKKPTGHKPLTAREQEVLNQLAAGSTNREIASTLVISECTVKNHIHNMLEKLQIHNRTQLISHALTTGLCPMKTGAVANR